jgi:diaminopimelate decarboxylase
VTSVVSDVTSFGVLVLLCDLDIEPGRAMLDQCGLALARVAEVTIRGGQRMVRVEANRDDIGFEAGGVLVDSVVIARDPRRVAGPCGVYLVGNLCLEHDFLTRRLVALRQTPAPGDLLAFVNTAGYVADFAAQHALRQPVATTVAVTTAADGSWRWCHDDQFWPPRGAHP